MNKKKGDGQTTSEWGGPGKLITVMSLSATFYVSLIYASVKCGPGVVSVMAVNYNMILTIRRWRRCTTIVGPPSSVTSSLWRKAEPKRRPSQRKVPESTSNSTNN